KPTNVADCHVTAFQCHPFLQRIAGLAGWVLAATALAAFANNLISCVDGPRLARDHLACSAEVACSHVSGLLVQSGGTAGPDGVREPSPHHSNGIDVPMKRQVWLGCVGSTDCAITRHCSLASSRTWLSGLSRRGHALVVLMPVHHRPGDAGGLVGERDGYDQRRSPPTEPDHPRIGFGRLRSQQISAGAVDQKPAQILVAALGYPAQAMFAAGGILPWHQAQPGRELAPTAEAARFYHRGGDARNARQALLTGLLLCQAMSCFSIAATAAASCSICAASTCSTWRAKSGSRASPSSRRSACRRCASPAARSRRT